MVRRSLLWRVFASPRLFDHSFSMPLICLSVRGLRHGGGQKKSPIWGVMLTWCVRSRRFGPGSRTLGIKFHFPISRLFVQVDGPPTIPFGFVGGESKRYGAGTAKRCGATRRCVACSNAYAISIRRVSRQAIPVNITPNGAGFASNPSGSGMSG